MASIEQNKTWSNGLGWTERGEDWSAAYGTARMQWLASILPRIGAFLPAATILEIAPGFGRWTQFLKEQCETLMVVDLSEKCIDGCRERFKDETHIQYHLNDGRSLAMIPDGAIDFLFTFDSLVHVEKDVIGDYLKQLATKITPQGAGFIHHSNLGEFAGHYAWAEKVPRGRRLLSRLGLLEATDHKRAKSMTADIFLSLAEAAGLKVVTQELINWETRRPIDCLSVITRPESKWDRGFQRVVNRHFDWEAAAIKRLAGLYDFGA